MDQNTGVVKSLYSKLYVCINLFPIITLKELFFSHFLLVENVHVFIITLENTRQTYIYICIILPSPMHYYSQKRKKMDTAIVQKMGVKFCTSPKALLIIFYCILQTIGQVGGPLLTRIYFLNGGKRKWIPAWLLTAGFPCLIIPIFVSYITSNSKRIFFIVPPKLVIASAIIGSLLGIDSYMYTIGGAYLPVSVSSLLSSSQLAFTSIFAFFVVKQKFTHYSINAVVLMTFGSVILGLHMKGDRPAGESNGSYTLGFFMTLTAAALHGFLMPAIEYTQQKAGVSVTYDLLLQFQFLVSAFATLFCTIPIIINKDFQVQHFFFSTLLTMINII